MLGALSSLLKYKCTKFSGSSQYVTFGNQTTYDFERTNSFSLSSWVQTTTTNFSSFINKLTNSGPFRGYDMYLDNLGRVGWTLQSDGTPSLNQLVVVTTRTGLNDGKWHHIVGTYDGTSAASGMKIYVDGVSEALTVFTDSLSGTIKNSVTFAVGARPSGGAILALNGQMMDAAVYSKTLTQGEVTAIHNRHCPPNLQEVGPTGNLVGYWLLGQHVGKVNLNSLKTSGTNCPDGGSGAHAGTMAGATVITRK